jgi:hypothetical protein
MPAALCAEASELFVLVPLASLADQLGVWILGRTGLAALSADDAKPLLRQVRASEVVGEIGGREDQCAVGEGKHQQLSRPRVGRI